MRARTFYETAPDLCFRYHGTGRDAHLYGMPPLRALELACRLPGGPDHLWTDWSLRGLTHLVSGALGEALPPIPRELTRKTRAIVAVSVARSGFGFSHLEVTFQRPGVSLRTLDERVLRLNLHEWPLFDVFEPWETTASWGPGGLGSAIRWVGAVESAWHDLLLEAACERSW